MGKNIGQNISENLSGICSQNVLDHAKQSPRDALKTTSKRLIQKTAEATGDFIGKNVADKLAKSCDVKTTKVSKNLRQNNLETVTNEHAKEILKERYIFLEKRQKIIEDQTLI